MLEREIDRRRERGRTKAPPAPLPRDPHVVLALQRSIGNRAVTRVLARAPAASGTVSIHGVGEIKVKGDNLEAWTGADTPQTVDVTSHKGRHSAKLEKLSEAGTKSAVKVTIAAANKAGEQLNVGGGTVLEIKDARVEHYTDAGGTETWRLGDFTNVHRTKVTHTIA